MTTLHHGLPEEQRKASKGLCDRATLQVEGAPTEGLILGILAVESVWGILTLELSFEG